MKSKNITSEIKENVLTEVISAVYIIDVDVKNPNDEDIQLYIKTNNLNTVNLEKLSEICNKFSNKKVIVNFQIPDEKLRDGKTFKNLDTVCIFITTTAADFEFDPSLVFPS